MRRILHAFALLVVFTQPWAMTSYAGDGPLLGEEYQKERAVSCCLSSARLKSCLKSEPTRVIYRVGKNLLFLSGAGVAAYFIGWHYATSGAIAEGYKQLSNVLWNAITNDGPAGMDAFCTLYPG